MTRKVLSQEDVVKEKMALCLAYDFLKNHVDTQEGKEMYAISPFTKNKITLADSMKVIKEYTCLSQDLFRK